MDSVFGGVKQSVLVRQANLSIKHSSHAKIYSYDADITIVMQITFHKSMINETTSLMF